MIQCARFGTDGCNGWSYADVLPYFRKAQSHELGADAYRGSDGPLRVTTRHQPNELFDVFVEAGVQAGYNFTDDLNGYCQEGVGMMDATIADGKRWSAATAYLHPAMLNSDCNITVHTQRHASKVVLDGRSSRAVCVETIMPTGQKAESFVANKEIIVAAGAINSPQLLLLSGIGDAKDLASASIDVRHHLPGVGKNFQDHLDLYLQWECKKPITLYDASYVRNQVLYGLEWILRGTGMCASAHLEAGGFIRTRAGVPPHTLPSLVH